MAMSIDDIWDASPENTPPRKRKELLVSETNITTPTRPSSAKRRRTTLFLSSDSEDESPGPSKAPYRKRTPPQTDKDKQKALIDALFDDLDDDDGFKELAPALDIDALRQQAGQQQKKTRIPALTPHEILPSSSPPRDLGPDEDVGGASKQPQGKGKKDADGAGKQRKQIAKLDEARLIGETGFPALIKQTKDFRPRGKGHEV
jgi:replication fork protection complex subunit Csm3/Swi3